MVSDKQRQLAQRRQATLRITRATWVGAGGVWNGGARCRANALFPQPISSADRNSAVQRGPGRGELGLFTGACAEMPRIVRRWQLRAMADRVTTMVHPSRKARARSRTGSPWRGISKSHKGRHRRSAPAGYGDIRWRGVCGRAKALCRTGWPVPRPGRLIHRPRPDATRRAQINLCVGAVLPGRTGDLGGGLVIGMGVDRRWAQVNLCFGAMLPGQAGDPGGGLVIGMGVHRRPAQDGARAGPVDQSGNAAGCRCAVDSIRAGIGLGSDRSDRRPCYPERRRPPAVRPSGARSATGTRPMRPVLISPTDTTARVSVPRPEA